MNPLLTKTIPGKSASAAVAFKFITSPGSSCPGESVTRSSDSCLHERKS